MNSIDENKGCLESLEQQIKTLVEESKDPEYTEYLKKMTDRLRYQKYQVDLLQDELERSHRMYLGRMNRNATGVSENVRVQEYKDAEVEHPVVQNIEPQQQAAPQYGAMPTGQVPEKKKNTEFTIGATVLSVVGGGFILAALVTLGMTLMGGLFKGICLYGIALLFLLVSELLVYRRVPMLGSVLSSIGIGGLYLATAVNYLGLHNFGVGVSLIITLVITFAVVVFSRKRDSVLYRLLGLIAGYLCFFTIREGITEIEFIVVSGLVLLMNVLVISLPVRKHRTGLAITHMWVNSFFTLCFVIRAKSTCDLPSMPVLIFVMTSIVVLQLLFVMQYFHYKKENGVKESTGIISAYYISNVFYAITTVILVRDLVLDNGVGGNDWYAYGTAIVVGVMGLLALMVLSIGKCRGWSHVYTFLNMMIFCIIQCASLEVYVKIICVLTILLVAKILSRKQILTLKINDIVFTAIVCIMLWTYDEPLSYIFVFGIVISYMLMSHWYTCYEILLTGTLVLYIASLLPEMLQLPAIVGLLLVGILVFNNVKRWQGKDILVFNIISLIGQAICFAKLLNPVYENEYLIYLFMLIFGLATIVLTFQEKYQMDFKGKHMILAIFLTYMVFIIRTDMPLVNSILLMVIALVSVGVGFAWDKKSVRIYGLVLSLIVCGKLVLYDFFDAATLQKTILFFVVGVIALVIAGIYIILEKKNNS